MQEVPIGLIFVVSHERLVFAIQKRISTNRPYGVHRDGTHDDRR